MSLDYLKDIVQRLKTDYKLEDLQNYRSFFKKHVPFFTRQWVCAALLIELDKQNPNRNARGIPASPKRQRGGLAKKESLSRRGQSERTILSEEEGVGIFFSAGRKRKVFARDIAGFIAKETTVPREDVGDIRVLDHYSFIQVRKNMAEAFIDQLDGKKFRGRALTVSYARTKADGSDD